MKHYLAGILLPMAIITSCSTRNTAQLNKYMNTETSLTKIHQTVGIGLLEMNTNHPIPLFRSAADSVPFETLKFEMNHSGTTKFISGTAIVPYRLSIGDSFIESKRHISGGPTSFAPELKFRVINTVKSIFEVVLNEQTMEVGFINMETYLRLNQIHENDSMVYKFDTWPDYLRKAEFITKKNLVIYDHPDGNIIYENRNEMFLPFNVTEVSGDWIRLKKAFGREFNFDDIIDYNGWTQWKTADSILIRITEHTFE